MAGVWTDLYEDKMSTMLGGLGGGRGGGWRGRGGGRGGNRGGGGRGVNKATAATVQRLRRRAVSAFPSPLLPNERPYTNTVQNLIELIVALGNQLEVTILSSLSMPL